MRYRPRRSRAYKAGKAPIKPVKPVRPKAVTLELFRLNDKERATLLALYHFSKTRRFRYGLNERYIPDPSHLDALLRKGLAFYKKAHGYRYWLLTKRGREVAESLP